jgi:hypothetical protein
VETNNYRIINITNIILSLILYLKHFLYLIIMSAVGVFDGITVEIGVGVGDSLF